MSKVILICGSRDYPRLNDVAGYVASLPAGTAIISGGAAGVDRTAEQAARVRGLTLTVFPARWDTDGKAAGFKRNIAMLDERPDKVVAFHDGFSRGTLHTLVTAVRRGIPTLVFALGDLGYPKGIAGAEYPPVVGRLGAQPAKSDSRLAKYLKADEVPS